MKDNTVQTCYEKLDENHFTIIENIFENLKDYWYFFYTLYGFELEICKKWKGVYIDLGYIDLTKRVPEIDKFLNDSHFTKLEIAWIALGYKEGMFPIENEKSNNIRNLHDALSRCGVVQC